MDLVDYLRVLRRRWRLIALAILLGAIAGYFTAPSSSPGATSSARTYQATATLLQSPQTQEPVNIPLTRLYVVTGDIPQRAATALGYKGDPAVLAQSILVGGDDHLGSITIAASGPDGAAAAKTANAFAQATLDYLSANALDSQRQQIQTLQQQLSRLQKQINGISPTAGGVRGARRDSLVQQYSALYSQLGTVTRTSVTAPLTLLQKATPIPVKASSTLTAPRSRTSRLAIAIVLALLLGAGLALVIERFDTRLRSRLAVEDAFRLPVVAELPVLSRHDRRVPQIASLTAPGSPAAESYRAIRTALYLMPSLPLARPQPAATPVEPGVAPSAAVPAPVVPSPFGSPSPPQVVLLTSATPQMGKTRTTANLAACIAETGKSVLVLDCDLRNPSLGRYFDVGPGWGLTDLVASGRVRDLRSFARRTNVPNVSLVSAGSSGVHPAVLLARMQEILDVARRLADVVLIDAPPIIGTSDALDLMPHVDSVIVLAWAGRTRREHAARSAELLSRLAVPVLGVALVTAEAPMGYGSRPRRAGRLRGRASQAQATQPVPSGKAAVAPSPEARPKAPTQPKKASATRGKAKGAGASPENGTDDSGERTTEKSADRSADKRADKNTDPSVGSTPGRTGKGRAQGRKPQ